jgi:hypothetical protein
VQALQVLSDMAMCKGTASSMVGMDNLGGGNGKAMPVRGRRLRGPQGCETSRLLHFVDTRLTDGGEVASLTRRPPFTPRKIPGTHFC